MSAEVIQLMQQAEAAFRDSGRLSPELMQQRLFHAHNAVYCAMRAAGIDPLPYR